MAPRLPFNLVSGYLGSGKTSLINQLLARDEFANAAVIVNELGAVGIDHLLFETGEESLALLGNGCLCCALRSDLSDALERLERRRAELGLEPFSRVIVETSGRADPGPVLMSLFSEPSLAARCRLDSVIVTADVLELPRQLGRRAEAARQLALADRIVLTKTDLATRARLGECRALARRCNPAARILVGAEAVAAPGRILRAGLFDPSRGRARVAPWLGARAHAAAPAPVHADAVQAFSVSLAARVPWRTVHEWLGALLALQGEQILRVKGVVHLSDHAQPVAVHAIHHQLHPPVALAARDGVPRESTFVFVTDGLSRADVLESLRGWGLPGTVPAAQPVPG